MKLTSHDLPLSYWEKKAKQNGILKKTFQTRVYRGWSPKDASTMPTRQVNVKKRSTRDKCRQAGLTEDAVWRYRRYHGSDEADEAIIEYLANRRDRETVNSMALANGVNPSTARWRACQGWDVEDAVTRPPMGFAEAGRKAMKAKGRKEWLDTHGTQGAVV